MSSPPHPAWPPLPLAGLRIVELSSYLAAPLGGMTLAQLGADVIRVDPPHGTPDRQRWPLTANGESLYWVGLNKGKRSVGIDMRQPAGRELVTRLVTAPGDGGGILLTNIGDRNLLPFQELVGLRPDLIRVQLHGHPDGRNAVDYTVNAATGFASVTGPEEYTEPINHVLPAWDVACGLYLAIGLLSAERARRLTGAPQNLTIALHDVALATASNLGFLAEAELNGATRPKIGNAVYGTYVRWFHTADQQRVIVAALTERHWRDLVAMTGTGAAFSGLASRLDADFSHEADRYVHRHLLDAVLAPWFAHRTHAQVADAFDHSSVPWSRFSTFSELVDPESADLTANPIMARINQPGIGRHFAAGSPLVFGGRAVAPRPAPQLGQDTATVLSELLDIDDRELTQLAGDGVILPVPPVDSTSQTEGVSAVQSTAEPPNTPVPQVPDGAVSPGHGHRNRPRPCSF